MSTTALREPHRGSLSLRRVNPSRLTLRQNKRRVNQIWKAAFSNAVTLLFTGYVVYLLIEAFSQVLGGS